jgi:hypothetical protein
MFEGLVITYYSHVNAQFVTATQFAGEHNLAVETDYPGWPEPAEFPMVGLYDNTQTAYSSYYWIHRNNERVEIALDLAEGDGVLVNGYAYILCHAVWDPSGDDDDATPPNPNPGASVAIQMAVTYRGTTYNESLWIVVTTVPPRVLRALVIIDERGIEGIPVVTINVAP